MSTCFVLTDKYKNGEFKHIFAEQNIGSDVKSTVE
jgi:hypothetical protein